MNHYWQLETPAADSVKLFKLLLIEWHRIKRKRLEERGRMGGGGGGDPPLYNLFKFATQ